MDIYRNVKYRGSIEPSLIKWHIYEFEWLDKVAPFAGMRLRKSFGNRRMRHEPKDEAEKKLYRLWGMLIDGLLGSQLRHYQEVRRQQAKTGDGETEPWYFEILDECAKLPEVAIAMASGKE